MPANLTPQYHDAEQRYKQATTSEDKVSALQDMMAIVPKHKGTEKLQAEIKRKLSQARKELLQKGKGAKRQDPSNIPREGAGRVVLIGPGNSGKSALLKAMTNAQPEVAPWEFTTRTPEQGMIQWEDIQFQLIDLPAICRQHMEYWVMNLVRSADILFFVIDHSKPGALEDVETVSAILAENKIYMGETGGDIPKGSLIIPTLLVINKMELPSAEENADVIAEFFGRQYEIFHVSAESGYNLPELKLRVFEMLQIVRIYSKMPGKPPESERPYVLKKGSTIGELCRKIHNDFADNLKFARVWGSNTFEGQRVNREFELSDGDVVELHR